MSKAFRHLWASLIIRNRPVLPSFPDTWLKGTFPLALNLGVAMGLTLGNELETQLGASLVTKRFNHQCVICQDLYSAQINQKRLLTWSFHLPGSQHRDHQEQSSFNREHKMQMSFCKYSSHSPWDLGFLCCDCRNTESIRRDLVIKIYITPNPLFSSHLICSVCWGQLMLLKHRECSAGKDQTRLHTRSWIRVQHCLSTKFPETETKWIWAQSW